MFDLNGNYRQVNVHVILIAKLTTDQSVPLWTYKLEMYTSNFRHGWSVAYRASKLQGLCTFNLYRVWFQTSADHLLSLLLSMLSYYAVRWLTLAQIVNSIKHQVTAQVKLLLNIMIYTYVKHYIIFVVFIQKLVISSVSNFRKVCTTILNYIWFSILWFFKVLTYRLLD